jgi:hypothetical protein
VLALPLPLHGGHARACTPPLHHVLFVLKRRHMAATASCARLRCRPGGSQLGRHWGQPSILGRYLLPRPLPPPPAPASTAPTAPACRRRCPTAATARCALPSAR